jgi:hypothetical protein
MLARVSPDANLPWSSMPSGKAIRTGIEGAQAAANSAAALRSFAVIRGVLLADSLACDRQSVNQGCEKLIPRMALSLPERLDRSCIRTGQSPARRLRFGRTTL